jgi:hypothetical protein
MLVCFVLYLAPAKILRACQEPRCSLVVSTPVEVLHGGGGNTTGVLGEGTLNLSLRKKPPRTTKRKSRTDVAQSAMAPTGL